MSLSNYPPGVTGNEPEISGIYPLDQVVDSCLEQFTSVEDNVNNILADLDEQNAGLSAKEEADILEALEAFKDAISDKRPPEYDPFDDRI
jgi:hypothetical protein